MTNSLGMSFVSVPLEGKSVWVSVFETRVRDFAVFVRATQHKPLKADFRQTGSHPAVNVNWDDARAFCAWLSKKEKCGYRLPTDHEWSILAGIGTMENPKIAPNKQPQIAAVHPWGSGRIAKGDGNYCDESFGEVYGDGYQAEWLRGYNDGAAATARVGSFTPDRHGIHDLGGNVWEWCEDWYDNAQKARVLRGGSWNNNERGNLLSSNRNHNTPTNRNNNNGFRCVLVVSGGKARQPAGRVRCSRFSVSTSGRCQRSARTLVGRNLFQSRAKNEPNPDASALGKNTARWRTMPSGAREKTRRPR